MHFNLLLLLAPAALAFTIPEGQLNGLYEVHTAPNGTETHTLIGSLSGAIQARSAVPGKFLAHKRQVSSVSSNTISCGGDKLDAGDTNSAYATLKDQCGNGVAVPKNKDVYSISNCVVAYFCNESGGDTFCYSNEMQEAGNGITDLCGSFWSGWDEFSASSRSGSYGYEDVCTTGKYFCHRGISG